MLSKPFRTEIAGTGIPFVFRNENLHLRKPLLKIMITRFPVIEQPDMEPLSETNPPGRIGLSSHPNDS